MEVIERARRVVAATEKCDRIRAELVNATRELAEALGMPVEAAEPPAIAAAPLNGRARPELVNGKEKREGLPEKAPRPKGFGSYSEEMLSELKTSAEVREIAMLEAWLERKARGDVGPRWGEYCEFAVTLADGKLCTVVYEPPDRPRELHHFSFHGPMSPTGYYSHFFNRSRAGRKTLQAYAESVAIEKHAERSKKPPAPKKSNAPAPAPPKPRTAKPKRAAKPAVEPAKVKPTSPRTGDAPPKPLPLSAGSSEWPLWSVRPPKRAVMGIVRAPDEKAARAAAEKEWPGRKVPLLLKQHYGPIAPGTRVVIAELSAPPPPAKPEPPKDVEWCVKDIHGKRQSSVYAPTQQQAHDKAQDRYPGKLVLVELVEAEPEAPAEDPVDRELLRMLSTAGPAEREELEQFKAEGVTDFGLENWLAFGEFTRVGDPEGECVGYTLQDKGELAFYVPRIAAGGRNAKPSLKGRELIARMRKLLGVPEPKGAKQPAAAT